MWYCAVHNEDWNILGVLERINPDNGLCELSAEGQFVAGKLHGKIK